MEQLIINALKRACGNRNIKFQVVIQDGLHIYANHRQDYHPQYAILEANVGAAIASLGLEKIDSVWLYARPLGQIEPNWQVFVELPTQVSGGRERDTEGKQNLEASKIDFNNLPDPKSSIEVESNDAFISNSERDTGKIENLDRGINNPTGSIGFNDTNGDSVEDTGLLQNTGLIHGSPLRETEIDTLSSNLNPERVSDDLTLDKNSQTQYCFVTNQKLLTEEVTPPKKDTMRMVKFVHHLSKSDRQQLLQILDSYFQEGITQGLETASPIRDWVEKIKELNEEDRHLLAVWLSRYCFNPELTLEEFSTISAAKAAENNKNSQKSSSATEYSFVLNRNLNSIADKDSELDKPKFQPPPLVKKLLLPGIWILTTVILIISGIFSHNSKVVHTSAQIPALCRNTIGSSEYCRLAVNLAGERAIAQAPKNLFPLTKVTQTAADSGCGRYANLKAGIDIVDTSPATTPVMSTYGEKFFLTFMLLKSSKNMFDSQVISR